MGEKQDMLTTLVKEKKGVLEDGVELQCVMKKEGLVEENKLVRGSRL